MDWIYGSTIALACVAVLMLVWAGLMAWQVFWSADVRLLSGRLQALEVVHQDVAGLELVKRRAWSAHPGFDAWLHRWPVLARWDDLLVRSGVTWSLAQCLGLFAGSLLAMLCLIVVLPWPWPVVFSAWLILLISIYSWLEYRCRHRISLMEMQMPNALDIMARAMQSGHALVSALLIAANETPQPLGRELQRVFDEINFGMTVQQALSELAHRVASEDVRYFVVAVLIQVETGGNLSEILGSISKLIRERQKLFGDVRVLSAEGRISAVILSIIPFGLAGVLTMVNPEFMSRLWTDPAGQQLVFIALILWVLGIFWMSRLVRIQV
jgi:tight adherence protein B